MVQFKRANRDQLSFMLHNFNDYLPEDHLARSVVEIKDKLNLQRNLLNDFW